MPLILSKTVFENAKLGIWRIEEKDTFFYEQLQLNKDELKLISMMSEKKKTEWLSSRYLVHLMSSRPHRASILKDEFGKPYILDADHFISFSHSNKLSVAIASPKVVGIDIQLIVPKITRIAKRFVSDDEEEFLINVHSSMKIPYLHIIWGAKESLYKAYGKRGLDLKKNMHLEFFEWNGNKVNFKGNVLKDSYSARFSIFAEQLENYILVYAEEI